MAKSSKSWLARRVCACNINTSIRDGCSRPFIGFGDLSREKERHLVECLFNETKHYRRIFSRHE
jgi:hypothetical protein